MQTADVAWAVFAALIIMVLIAGWRLRDETAGPFGSATAAPSADSVFAQPYESAAPKPAH